MLYKRQSEIAEEETAGRWTVVYVVVILWSIFSLWLSSVDMRSGLLFGLYLGLGVWRSLKYYINELSIPKKAIVSYTVCGLWLAFSLFLVAIDLESGILFGGIAGFIVFVWTVDYNGIQFS
jgi:hypothetical protein